MWRVAVGHNGWVRVDGVEEHELPGPLYLRLTRQDDGRYQVTELYFDGRGKPLTARMLRELPLAQLESVALDHPPFHDDYPQVVGVDLSTLASYFGHTFSRRATHWVAQSQHDYGKVPRAKDPDLTRRPKRTAPLSAPEDGRLSDKFLGRVADAYNAAVSDGDRRPAVTLAEQASVAPDTARRWIYLARKGGHLPPGRQGRIG